MNTTEYISELLFDNDLVIVPGLGAFVANRVAATIDDKRGVMLPPRREVVFNKSISHNDGVLVSYMAAMNGVSYEAANYSVADFVHDVHRKLNLGEAVMLPGIGTLRKDADRVLFSSDASGVFLPESYGFAALPVQRLAMPELVRRSVDMGVVRRMAASAAAVVALLMVSTTTRDGMAVDADINKAAIVSMFAPAKALPAEKTVRVEVAVAPEAQTQTNHYIIVASFYADSEAQMFIDNMAARGVNGLAKVRHGKRVRVAAAKFSNKPDAIEKNRAVRKIAGFEKAWVLSVEE